MTFNMTPSIYLPLSTYPDPVEASSLKASVAVARHVGASIMGAGVEVDIPPVKNKLAEAFLHIQDQIRAVEQGSRAHAGRLLKELVMLGESSGVTVTCESVRAQPALLDDAVLRDARFHDLIVLPMPRDNPTAQGTAGALIFGSGRPVLLLAAHDETPPNLDTVVVATDFGRVATRAMFDAQPFLMRAGKICVVTVTDEKDVSHGDRTALAAHFKRQGLAAEFIQLEARGASVGAVLENYIEQIGGGLLVMGAFGHSRLRDFILGGATRSVLSSLRHPVLMSY
jgi:nucleotide-binding universal stress UspA family protein